MALNMLSDDITISLFSIDSRNVKEIGRSGIIMSNTINPEESDQQYKIIGRIDEAIFEVCSECIGQDRKVLFAKLLEWYENVWTKQLLEELARLYLDLRPTVESNEQSSIRS